jgi:hypothetical protein
MLVLHSDVKEMPMKMAINERMRVWCIVCCMDKYFAKIAFLTYQTLMERNENHDLYA